MAQLYALQGNFESAIVIYEELGFGALENRLLKYSADEYLFRWEPEAGSQDVLGPGLTRSLLSLKSDLGPT